VNSYSRYVDARGGYVSREIFADQEIYKRELETVFARAWLFIGHESQVPNPGDFFLSRMGEESVILTRDRKSQIHVLLNSCRHRGMKVCRYDQGNANLFTCPYHKWSYSTDGSLHGVPQHATIYAGALDKSKHSLVEPPHVTNYKGSIWASWDPDAPPLLEYLGPMKDHLDIALDSRDGREGNVEVVGGVQKWIIPCNWKIPSENFLGDSYHGPSHMSADMVGIGPSGRSGQKTGRRDNLAEGGHELWVSFAGGHGVHSAYKGKDAPYFPEYLDSAAAEAYARKTYYEREERLGEKARLANYVGHVFPNVSFRSTQPRQICVWHPHSATSVEAWSFFLVDKDAPEEVKDFFRRYYLRYAGPAGMTEQDDMDNWKCATESARGTIAKRYPFVYQQSMGVETDQGVVPGLVAEQMTEHMARAFYQVWGDYMDGESWEQVMCDRGPASRTALPEQPL
jgi:phenylpropionate dioxygenase-like ring-hydroxylating dioxygenase large terminal subunit